MAAPWTTGIHLEHKCGKWGGSIRAYDLPANIRCDYFIVSNATDIPEVISRIVALMRSKGVAWQSSMKPGLYVPGDGEDPQLLTGWPADWRDQVKSAAKRHGFDYYIGEEMI